MDEEAVPALEWRKTHLAVLLLLGTGAGGVPEIESAGVEPVILS